MKKTTIYLDEEVDLLLRRVAARRGSSRTELIRTAIRELLMAESGERRRPRSLGSSGKTDTSTRVDEILKSGFGA